MMSVIVKPREETFVFYNDITNEMAFITYNREAKMYVVETEYHGVAITTMMSLDSIMAKQQASGLKWETLGTL